VGEEQADAGGVGGVVWVQLRDGCFTGCGDGDEERLRAAGLCHRDP